MKLRWNHSTDPSNNRRNQPWKGEIHSPKLRKNAISTETSWLKLHHYHSRYQKSMLLLRETQPP